MYALYNYFIITNKIKFNSMNCMVIKNNYFDGIISWNNILIKFYVF